MTHSACNLRNLTVIHLFQAVTNCETPNRIAQEFKNFCICEIERRFGGIEFNKPLAIATMLDPRFIKAYFEVMYLNYLLSFR